MGLRIVSWYRDDFNFGYDCKLKSSQDFLLVLEHKKRQSQMDDVSQCCVSTFSYLLLGSFICSEVTISGTVVVDQHMLSTDSIMFPLFFGHLCCLISLLSFYFASFL